MKKKKFDCIRMKDEIQKTILDEIKGLTAEERRKRTAERISSDPILGPIWREGKRISAKQHSTTEKE